MKRQSERNTEIAERRSEGYTLAEIGDCYGISKERVRQILELEHPRQNGRKGPLLLGLRALAAAVDLNESTVIQYIHTHHIIPAHLSSGGKAVYSADVIEGLRRGSCHVCGQPVAKGRRVYCSRQCEIEGGRYRNRPPEARSRIRETKKRYKARCQQSAGVSER